MCYNHLNMTEIFLGELGETGCSRGFTTVDPDTVGRVIISALGRGTSERTYVSISHPCLVEVGLTTTHGVESLDNDIQVIRTIKRGIGQLPRELNHSIR